MPAARVLVRVLLYLSRLIGVLFLSLLVGPGTVYTEDMADQVRRFTRAQEFDFAGWTLWAAGTKLGQTSLGAVNYLDGRARRQLVLDYFDLVTQTAQMRTRLTEIYADPSLPDHAAAAAPVAGRLAELESRQEDLEPLAESIFQEMVAVVLDDLGISLGGTPFPPVAFRFSRLPVALIVSPRTVIRQDANIQMNPDMSLGDQIRLEGDVEKALDVSALVVPVGGIGTYPTMVQETVNLVWLSEVVVHEWVHNYLTMHPLGINYETSPELRTMNETTATLVGKEMGRRVLVRYFPELAPAPPVENLAEATPPAEPVLPGEVPPFDFRAEMRITRVTVDHLLAEGHVEEAEAYMEQRRQVFWENGYRDIRRLNQAYFAFHGAYADEPGGAAGEDPVGEAVRTLWARTSSPAQFLSMMARMSSFNDLLAVLGQAQAIP